MTALGMDDTRMDLSQFDDGQTRNVPTTPHQITPLGKYYVVTEVNGNEE